MPQHSDAQKITKRKMTKTISITGTTILMLNDLKQENVGKNHSSIIEALVIEKHKTICPGKSYE